MNQGLTDWLNGNYKSPEAEKNSEGTGLLLAPISDTHPQLDFSNFDLTPPENFNKPQISQNTPSKIVEDNLKPAPEISQITTPTLAPKNEFKIKNEPELEIESQSQSESLQAQNTTPEPELKQEQEQKEPEQNLTQDNESENESEVEQVQEFKNEPEVENEINNNNDNENEFNIENAYRQKLTDPPDELWTDIAEPDNSFQAQIEDSELRRNNKFVNRLQKVLQGRRSKAAEEREREHEHEARNLNSYVSRIILLCVFMLITLAGAFGVSIYLERYTPEAFNLRAEKLFAQKNFDEAMNLYQKAYKIYPKEFSFLKGLAKSAEQAGHLQTANIALNEYLKMLPLDDTQNRADALKELERINGNNKDKNNSQSQSQPQQQVQVQNITKPKTEFEIEIAPKIEIPKMKSGDAKYNYELLLTEGNKNLIYRHYDLATNNFFEALRLKNNDVRAWLGLAESYRGKGLKSDAQRILQNAAIIFGSNPTVEMALKFLRQQKE